MIYELNTEANFWETKTMNSASFVCGYCGERVNSDQGMRLGYLRAGSLYHPRETGVYICTSCNLPTFIGDTKEGDRIQVPGINFGDPVTNLPENVNDIYEEARSSFSVEAYTGVILLCRTLLDHLAVSLGAEPNQSFQAYIDYLQNNHYVTGPSAKWADAIRTFGNKATHRLVINTKDQAELIIKFCEMILKSNYEYPALYDRMQNSENKK